MEQEILRMMSQAPGTLFSCKEIGRRVDRHRFREDANWARPHLMTLLNEGAIEQDDNGYYYVEAHQQLSERE
jgi:hypothetical protein